MDFPGRCAAAAAVDRWGHVYVLGGWNDDRACEACEALPHPRGAPRPISWKAAPQRPSPSRASGSRRQSGGSGSSALDGDGGDPSASCGPQGDSFDCCVGGALSRSSEEAGPGGAGGGSGENSWLSLPPLSSARCFLGAAFEPRGALLAVGGGTGLYTSATAFATVEVLRPGEA